MDEEFEMRNVSYLNSSETVEDEVDSSILRDRYRRLVSNTTSSQRKVTRFGRYCNLDRILRLARLPVSISIFSLSFDFQYPIWTYHVALAGIVFFWGVIQIFDMDCGGVPEINVIIHICLDTILTIVSVTMLFKLGLMKDCDIGDASGCRYFWWVMCLWDNLAVFNILLVYHSIKNYPARRRGNRKLMPRIMFTPSGEPVSVTLNPAVPVQSISSRHSFDSLCLESDNDDVNRSQQSMMHIV